MVESAPEPGRLGSLKEGSGPASIGYHMFSLRTSPVHGKGVFAGCDIPEGSHLDLFPNGERFVRNEDIPPGQQEQYDWFGVKDEAEGGYWIPHDMDHKDMGWYLNHSGHPNATSVNGGQFYASRDIKEGEEILIDYSTLGSGNLTKESSSKGANAYLYHVAQPGTLGGIAKEGLQGGVMGPKVFLTEIEGVDFWRGHDMSAPVLRVRRDLLEGLEPDSYGTKDSGIPCYSAEAIPADRLEFRVDTPQGEAWRPVRYALASRTAALYKLALNIPRLVQDFGKKLLERYEADIPGALSSPEELIRHFTSFDPTENHEYTAWLTGSYARGELGSFGGLRDRVAPLLQRFHGLKKTKNLKPQDTNIQRVKGLAGLQALLEKYAEVEAESRRQRAVSREQAFYKNGEARLVYDDPEMKVVVPETEEASKFFGVNTKWCTAWDDTNNAFEQYHAAGPLYIVLLKRENQRFQFHFQTAQFVDEEDKPLDIEDWLAKHPKVARVLQPLAQGAGSTSCDACDGTGGSRCEDCDGSGTVECQECGGKGSGYCKDCYGKGVKTCTNCDGTGTAWSGAECPECGGSRQAQCGSCKGTGRAGRAECQECGGEGSTACGNCENGIVQCSKCEGTGMNSELARFLEGCEAALAGPLSVPALRSLRKKKWPALKKRVKDWVQPRRTPVNLGPGA